MIKQLLLYKVVKDSNFVLPTNLGELLEANSKFSQCKPNESGSDGFVHVKPGELFSYDIRDTGLNISIATFQRQKKVIPQGELKKRVKMRIAVLMTKGVKITKDSREDAEIQMRREMAKTAFSNYSTNYVVFFHDLQVVGVNAGESLADDITALLRNSLPNNTFPVVPYGNKGIQNLLLSCIQEEDDHFAVGEKAFMVNESDRSEIVFKNKSIEELAEKAKTHRVNQLSLEGLDMQLDLADGTPINLSKMKHLIELEKIKPSMDEAQKREIFDSNIRLEMAAVQSVIKKLLLQDNGKSNEEPEKKAPIEEVV